MEREMIGQKMTKEDSHKTKMLAEVVRLVNHKSITKNLVDRALRRSFFNVPPEAGSILHMDASSDFRSFSWCIASRSFVKALLSKFELDKIDKLRAAVLNDRDTSSWCFEEYIHRTFSLPQPPNHFGDRFRLVVDNPECLVSLPPLFGLECKEFSSLAEVPATEQLLEMTLRLVPALFHFPLELLSLIAEYAWSPTYYIPCHPRSASIDALVPPDFVFQININHLQEKKTVNIERMLEVVRTLRPRKGRSKFNDPLHLVFICNDQHGECLLPRPWSRPATTDELRELVCVKQSVLYWSWKPPRRHQH